jgi:triacylglycerol lipase
MIQRILTLTNGLNLLFVAWCVHRAWVSGAAVFPLILVALVALIIAQVLLVALQFLLSALSNKGLAGMGLGGLLKAYVGELRDATVVFGVHQVLGVDALQDALDNAQGKRGVLLLHGYFCNRGLWRTQMQRLRAMGTPHMAITLEPAFGSISSYAPAVRSAVERLHAATGMAPVVVGHSMGGLAARAYVAAYGSDRISRIITVGTPHHGTFQAMAGLGENTQEMRLNSAWQASNAAQLSEAARSKFICFYSNGDNIVSPFKSATLEGADNRFVESSGHLHLAFTPEFRTELDKQLSL